MRNTREPLFDFYRSIFMLFVFWHHFYLTFPDLFDYVKWFNPFAELFVGLAGFMIGWIYLKRNQDLKLFKKGFQVIGAYLLVAVPFQMLINPSWQSLADVLLLNTSDTFIEILKFYGILFLIVPLLLTAFRKARVLVIALSIAVYLVGLFVHLEGVFWDSTLNLLIIYQFYFVLGVWLGELYDKKRLLNRQTIKLLLICSVLAIIAQISYFGFGVDEYPYNFQKALNNVYLIPVCLYTIYKLHHSIIFTWIYNQVNVIGRHSLAAFVISEIIRVLWLFIPVVMFDVTINEFEATVISLFFAALLIWLVHQYAKLKLFLGGLKYAANNHLRLYRN
ncbi:OpgC domain-containing protein [Alkalibacillus haloalkaliphilus]|uniref:OpgC domain-containing protein n=1 Tax=Alkalibacillus haloalkaliphilus TaxID=94136 RepID=UPI0003077496|nr:OpgC domain-containing protein [Alkalibacillus haloalkaliphilus]